MIKSEDMDMFFRIPADNRDLNYARYFSEGEENIAKTEDYNSHNTVQYGVEAIKKLLLQLDIIQNTLDNIN